MTSSRYYGLLSYAFLERRNNLDHLQVMHRNQRPRVVEKCSNGMHHRRRQLLKAQSWIYPLITKKSRQNRSKKLHHQKIAQHQEKFIIVNDVMVFALFTSQLNLWRHKFLFWASKKPQPQFINQPASRPDQWPPVVEVVVAAVLDYPLHNFSTSQTFTHSSSALCLSTCPKFIT